MAESWRDAPLVDEGPQPGQTPGGAVTGMTLRRRSTEPSFEEAWRSAPIVGKSPSAKAGAVAQGMTGGFIEGGSTLGGAVMGGKLGSLAGPWGMAGGSVLGALSGWLAGRTAREHAAQIPLGDSTLTTRSVEDMPPELRPWGTGGEAIGAGVPFAAMPFAAAGTRVASPFVNRIIESAERAPGAFAASEAAGLSGAGVAGGVAEAFDPGDTTTRMGAEIIGGFFNPTRIIAGTAKGAVEAVKTASSTWTQTGRENRAATILQDLVTRFGEDPAQLAKALNEANLPGVNITAAQKTGSPALIALEARLANESAKFGADSKKMADDGLASIKNLTIALEGTGHPEALKAAAETRAQYFRALIAGRVQIAEREAADAAASISRDDPLVRTQLAKDSKTALEKALTDTRAVERDLWSKVPQDIPAFPENLLAKYAEMKGQMLPEESMPAVVEGFVRRMEKGKGLVGPSGKPMADPETTTGELLLLRSRMLMFAREAEAKGAFNEARIYGNMAEASLDDLSSISASVPEIGIARQFSRELNETFTRTFAGEALAAKAGGGTRATGAERIPPELLMRRSFGAGREAGALRFKQLEEAMSFLPKKGLGGPEAEQNLAFMLNAQERVLRLSAKEALDPATGRVSPARMARFISDHAELLDRFPDVRQTLQTSLKSEQGLRDIQRMADDASKAIEKKSAFARVLKYDSPADAVRNSLASNTPAKDFIALSTLARRSGTDAVDGLRYSAWEDAIRRSTADNGELSFTRLQNHLFNPIRPGQPSLVQMLKSQGVMSAGDASRAEELIKRAIRIQDAQQSGGHLSDLAQNPDAVFDLMVRIAGAKAGSALAGTGGQSGGGHTLIAASRGSSFARSVFEKIPQGRVKDVLIEAAVNPQFGAMLLSKPRSKAEGIRLSRQIHAYLIQTGITGQDQDADILERGPDTSVIDGRLIPNPRPDRPATPGNGGVRG